jgi:hypothetical protein
MEIWKSIKGFPNYEISSYGRVWSKKSKIFLKQSNNCGKGYYQVSLCFKGKVNKKYVHHLVVDTFLPNFYDKKTRDHKNRNKLDNRLVNLRWATQSEQNVNRKCGGGIKMTHVRTYCVRWTENRIRKSKTFKTLEQAKQYLHKVNGTI